MADDDLDKALRSDHGVVTDPKADEAKQSIRHSEELQRILKSAPRVAPSPPLKCPKCEGTDVIHRSAQFQIFCVCKNPKCNHQWPRSMSLPNDGPEMPRDPREEALDKLQTFRDPSKNFRRGES